MHTIEVLIFPGCPNAEPALERARAVAAQHAGVQVVEIAVEEATVEQLRFLGSPSVRVDGHDVEPGADERTHFGFTCRRYSTPDGMVGVPPEAWIRDRLATNV